MKIDIEELRNAARNADGGGGGAVGEAASEAAGEAAESAAGEATRGAAEARPTMGINMGPEGTEIDLQAPLEGMDPKEAVEFAQNLQQPSATEQVVELLQKPEVQKAISQIWYGPEEGQQQQQIEPQDNQAMPNPAELMEADNPNEQLTEANAEENTEMSHNNQSGNAGSTEAQMPVNVPEGMDVDKTYNVLVTTLEAVAEEYPDLTPEEMVFVSRVMYDVSTSMGQMRPDATAESMSGMAGTFEGRIKSELETVIAEYEG